MSTIFEASYTELKKLEAENKRLRTAILWALGEQPDDDGKWFSEDRNDRPQGQGRRYWWRSHLRKIAGLKG
jgi:hypothetical protein